MSVEKITDKGVLYAKIRHTDETIIHAFNTHTESDSLGNMHETRVGQFRRTKDFIDRKNIPEDEMVFLGGDMNEDYFCKEDDNAACPDQYKPVFQNHEYYYRMLGILGANDAVWNDSGNGLYTYNSDLNQLLATLYENEGCNVKLQILDYVSYSNDHKRPNLDTSSCHVERPTDTDGYDLSDHLPVTCTYNFDSPGESPKDPIFVTVKSIKCIKREDNGWWQDDEIVVVINDQQIWPGSNPNRNWATFDTGEEIVMSTKDKNTLKRNIDNRPVYCLRELDIWNHRDIGCMHWDPTDLDDTLLSETTLVWDRTLQNDEGKYEIIFEISSE